MVSSVVPNAHVLEVILTPVLDMDKSIDDSRTELDYHDNIVVLG